ncbi:hypothetical protein BY996DRAFT_6578665 [Phakopsora pachyrhizi]|nr:hypothetical protein BY996DRAFT_6578665 [Phakopsora pachyrhizi]
MPRAKSSQATVNDSSGHLTNNDYAIICALLSKPSNYSSCFASSCQEEFFKNNKPEGSSGKKNALLPDGFSWKKNSQPPEEFSKWKFTLPYLNNMIARVKCCECPKNEDDKIYPLQPPR